MPTFSSMNLPKPKSWDEFEDMVCDVMKIRWGNSDLTRHGRPGQAQQGIDIYGDNDLGLFVGLQCKNTVVEIKKSVIEKEIENAESFTPTIKALYIATTADTDAKTQKDVRLLSKGRISSGRFPVLVLFWNDLQQDLVRDKTVFTKYYSQIFPPIESVFGQVKCSNKILCVFGIAYRGLRISEYIELLFGELGMISGEDPGQLTQLFIEIKSYAQYVFENTKYKEICVDLDVIENLCFKKCESKEENNARWEKVLSLARIVEKKNKVFETMLTGELLNAFALGEILAFLDMPDFNSYEDFQATVKKYHKEIIEMFKILGACKNDINEVNKDLLFSESNESMSIYNLSRKLYGIARKIIKDRMG